MKNVPELGIGMIYFSGLRNVLESNFDLIDVVEIEPQTFWIKNYEKLDSFQFNEGELAFLENINKPITFHGVGYPLAGSVPIDETHILYLMKMIDRLDPIWFSEHLSFNNVKLEGKSFNTNFLLPPLQSKEGLELACRNINQYKNHFDIPFLFETGTNYLQQSNYEIEDGVFINQVAENTDSYILLDIHNVLANEKNNRQSYWDFFNQLNPDRIVQIHLAGGFEYDGYYLDAHSSICSNELLNIFEQTIKKLPNIKAVTFEMLDDYANFISAQDLRKQFVQMNRIWDKRGIGVFDNSAASHFPIEKNKTAPTVQEWEHTLGYLAIEKEVEWRNEELLQRLTTDKGVAIIQSLVRKFKNSHLVSSLKLSCRYLMLKIGVYDTEILFKQFWKTTEPKLFGTDNGILFASYMLKEKPIADDHMLYDLINYEYSSLLTMLDSKERTITISFNPLEIILSLSNSKVPINYETGNYQIVIEPNPDKIPESISPIMHT